MGIELPTPDGGQAVRSIGSAETAAFGPVPESAGSSRSVENYSTERAASQEVRTVPQGGSGQGFSVQNVASVTSDEPSGQTAASGVSLDDVPVVAADEDLIEKQWVDSVKRAVRENRDDPFRQSEAISRLQADYLRKRYGKTVGQTGGA